MLYDDAIPESMIALLAVFEAELADVRFGEMDRAMLDAAAAAVRAAAAAVADAEAAAEAARGRLEAAREALVQKGQRALAYARIYAEGSPELAARLQSITFTRAPRRDEPSPDAAPRRRGRPPKPTTSEVSGTLALSTPG